MDSNLFELISLVFGFICVFALFFSRRVCFCIWAGTVFIVLMLPFVGRFF